MKDPRYTVSILNWATAHREKCVRMARTILRAVPLLLLLVVALALRPAQSAAGPTCQAPQATCGDGVCDPG